VGCAEQASTGCGHPDGIARFGFAPVDDVARIDPNMAGQKTVRASPGDADCWFTQRMACRRAIRSSVEGWVEKIRIRLWPLNGLMINI